MGRQRLGVGVLLGVILGSLLTINAQAQGPFTAQIQRAIAGLKGTANTFTAAQTITLNGGAATLVPGLICSNTTPSTAGVPIQSSPACPVLDGTAYNSVSTLSETQRWFIINTPASAAGTTGSSLQYGSIVNGGATTIPFSLSNLGVMTLLKTAGSPDLTITNATVTFIAGVEVGGDGFVATTTNHPLFVYVNNTLKWTYGTSGSLTGVAGSSVATPTVTASTAFVSGGSGMAVANVGANSCGTTAATIAGGNNAFVITVGATSGTQCRVAFTVAATAEWDCAANDDTTTVAVRTTPIDTTHTDLIGAFTAGDKVTGICFPR